MTLTMRGPCRRVRRSHPQGRQARRPACRAAHQIRGASSPQRPPTLSASPSRRYCCERIRRSN